MRHSTYFHSTITAMAIIFGLGLASLNSVYAGDESSPEPGQLTIRGDWNGSLKMFGVSLPVVMHFAAAADGSLAGNFDSPAQKAKEIPFDLVRQTGSAVHFDCAAISASFDGKLDASGKSISGTWTQPSLQSPLTLVRGLPIINRPQTPKAPFPCLVREVQFPGGQPGVTLSGTLTIPSGAGPFQAAVLVSGTGPQDRDETVFDHKIFWVLADSLTRRGIAVLRYDKRGVGKSTGVYGAATTADFCTDTHAALLYLKTIPQIDARRIGLIGHSEGGLIAPMLAAKSPDVAFIVLLAGPGTPGDKLLLHQKARMSKALGHNERETQLRVSLLSGEIDIVERQPDPVVARSQIADFARRTLGALPAEELEKLGASIEVIANTDASSIGSPWMRFFLTCDPAPILQKVSCPVLALGGDKDLQVPAAENLAGISAALKAGGNHDSTVKELPNLNHLFQTCETGSMAEYGKIEESFAPSALAMIDDWILAH